MKENVKKLLEELKKEEDNRNRKRIVDLAITTVIKENQRLLRVLSEN